jgi:hypothetical protein
VEANLAGRQSYLWENAGRTEVQLIEFLTLFVGLIIGQQNVELAVSGQAARVELRLNGDVVASRDGEPWVLRCDFGRELHPGRLEAVAYDERGRIIGTDEQWINLPTDRAEAEIVAERDSTGRVVGARLTWKSPEFDKPKNLKVTLDDAELKLKPPYRVDLSGVDADTVHVLRADFVFADDLSLRRELAFGKVFSGVHSSGLTALPVVLEDIDELPPGDQLEGWFTTGDKTLRVAGVERDPAKLVVVADPTTIGLVEELFRDRKKTSRRKRRGDEGPRFADELAEDVQVHVLIPEPVVPEGRTQATLLFPLSRKSVSGSEGVLKAVIAAKPGGFIGAGLMMGDAVAMASIRAAQDNHRRAVLVLLGQRREDISRVSPATVRGFAADLRVPLVVWDLSGDRTPPPQGWDPDREVQDVDDLRRAIRRLRYLLEAQRIVWLGGRYLPQELTLGPAAEGIALAE